MLFNTNGTLLNERRGRDLIDSGLDELIAALKVKLKRPEAVITYVRRQNRRGDARHPGHGLGRDN